MADRAKAQLDGNEAVQSVLLSYLSFLSIMPVAFKRLFFITLLSQNMLQTGKLINTRGRSLM